MSDADVINQESFMKLFSVSVHPSKAPHSSPSATLKDGVCSDFMLKLCVGGAGSCAQGSASGEPVGEPKTVSCAAVKQGTVNIYDPDTNNNAAIKPLLCVRTGGAAGSVLFMKH